VKFVRATAVWSRPCECFSRRDAVAIFASDPSTYARLKQRRADASGISNHHDLLRWLS
jgi:hypothetical protein